MSDSIRKFTFKGHKGSVLCLDHDSSSCLLLSGAEDSTARVWDLRTSKTALCLIAGGDVTSVAFCPSQSALEPLAGPFARNVTVFVSVENTVYTYDLRKATAPIIRQDARQVLMEASDEINQVSLSSRGDLWVSAADDSGNVQLTNPVTKRRRVLRHDSDNLAMVMSAVFRPKRKDEIASGGTDCVVHLWDVNKPRRPLSSFVMERDDTGANQICNPPMVHSLAWSPSGRVLAAGLGDGSCSILQVDNRKLKQVTRLREGHESSIASVMFPNWSTSGSKHVLAQDRLLATAETNGAILCWDLGKTIAGDGAVDPSSLFGESVIPLKDAVEKMSIDESLPTILFGIPHEAKPNWMVCSGNTDPVLPAAFFVADTSNEITVFSMPMR